MAAPSRGPLTAKHWVLIAAAAVLVVILLVRSVFDPANWASNILASAMVMFAVTSLLNLRREKTG
jgi:uncharacterized protein (DUF983 family)